MSLNIQTVHAHPDGTHVVNLGTDAETVVKLDPAVQDENANALIVWLKVDGNKAQSWSHGLDDIRKQKKAAVLLWIDNLTAQITSKYARDEIAAFGSKQEDAKRHLAGEDASILLVEEAALTGETTQDLAQTILDNNAVYKAITGKVSGLRRVTFANIDAAETPDAVQAAIDAALTSVTAMAGEMGLSVPGEA